MSSVNGVRPRRRAVALPLLRWRNDDQKAQLAPVQASKSQFLDHGLFP